MESLTLDLRRPYDLSASLRGLDTAKVVRVDDGWVAMETVDGPATVHVTARDSVLSAQAWGRGGAALLETLPRLLGLDDDPDAFQPPPGVVHDLHRRNRGMHLGSTGSVWPVLLPTIIGQVVAGKEAKRSYRSILRDLGDPAPGPRPELHLPPDPARVASMSYEELHRHGVERKRAVVLIEAARRIRRLEEIIDLDRDQAERRLRAVRGIGSWTAGIVMGVAYGDRDAVPVGDYHLPNTVAWALAGEARGTDERMIELLEPYRPYRRRAVMLLKQGGVEAPRYGPRRALRTHL
jgi:3-methyladenine DNA glycosylase/8-oxoguanine DNA glycosylase